MLLFRLERIGDLLMTLGAIGAIRARLPDAELRLVVGSWNAPLAHCMPAVDTIETFDVPWLSRDRPGSTLRAAVTQSALWRRRGFDGERRAAARRLRERRRRRLLDRCP